jgi:hypothetical protein
MAESEHKWLSPEKSLFLYYFVSFIIYSKYVMNREIILALFIGSVIMLLCLHTTVFLIENCKNSQSFCDHKLKVVE